MGDNLYTSYWQSVLPQIIEQFKQGKEIVQLPVTGLSKYGDRQSYYSNFRINHGKIEIPKNAYAQGRDLFAVLIEGRYFKEYLGDKVLQVTISKDLQLKIEILAEDAPDFYTEEDFIQLSRFVEQRMNKNNPEHQKTYDYLKETYGKTDYWARQVQKKLFPSGYVHIVQKPTNQASVFEYYHWAKIYPDKISFDFKALAFTVGIDTEDGFTIKIDTVGLYDNDPKRKAYLQKRGDHRHSTLVKHISKEQILDKGWQYLIDLTSNIILDLRPQFDLLFSELSGKKSSSVNQTSQKEISMELNTILYGPPGTGKTYKLLSLQKEFTQSKTVQTKEEFLNAAIKELTWWETVTASLMELKKATVPELEKHEFLQIKAKQSGTSHVKQLLWGSLQAHTDPKYPNVQTANRIEPYIFEKLEGSVWTVHAEEVEKNIPEIINFLNNVKHFRSEQKIDVKNYQMVTFHQSFSYEDFVEGIKPVISEENVNGLQYEIKIGIFYNACYDAVRLAGYNNLTECIDDDPESRKLKFENAPPCAIFIDEINRANVSSVFGELITLIEDDKRLGKEHEIIDIILPYSKTKFGVPANLYIIGTMNTADRSVEALDTALRRRFSFENIQPEPGLLNTTTDGIELAQLLTTINNRLECLLTKDHAIGHAWFMNVYNLNDLKAAFKNKILPLLQEYFYNDYAKIGLVLGKNFVEAKKENHKFADFDPDLANEYSDKTIYSLKDVSSLELKDFKSIYE